MELSASMRAVLRIAMAEARLCRNIWLEPEHLFLAVCKLVDFSEIINSIRDAREDVLWVVKLLADASLDCVTVRRRIRGALRKLESGKGGFTQHRSQRSIRVFDAAEELAVEENNDVIGVRHFMIVLMVEDSALVRQVVEDLEGSWHLMRRAVGLRERDSHPHHENSGLLPTESLTELGLDSTPNIKGYRILSLIDKGGMGVVWQAERIKTRQKVALKVIASRFFTSERAKIRFRREVQVAKGLRHKNIAEVYDSGVHRGDYFYAMELIDGQQLNKYVARARLSQQEIAQLMKEICLTLYFAHQSDVVHRDLKPSNILISEHRRHHVLDFGLAKILQDEQVDETLSIDGQELGTPSYMSPEQAGGCHDKTGVRTDVYSLGVILYELLCGDLPFRGRRDEIVHKVINEAPLPPSMIKEDICESIEKICLKAIAKEPDDRYQSAGEMAEHLDRFVQEA